MSITDYIPTDAEFAELEERILGRAARSDRNRRRRQLVIAAGAVVAVAATGIGAVVFATSEMREVTTYCYASADLSSLSTQVGTPTDIRDDDGNVVPSAVADAVDKCAAVWRIGFFANNGVPLDDGKVYAVPDLQLCMRPDGVPAVLPRTDLTVTARAFCDGLGLQLP